MMKKIVYTVTLISLIAIPLSGLAEKHCATQAIVTGKPITKVGFRAAVLKLAIKHNFAGYVRNTSQGVELVYQGKCSKVNEAINNLWTINDKACVTGINKTQVARNENLNTFTIYGWTSSSRCYYTPTNIVYTLHKGSGSPSSIYHDLIKQYKPPGGWKCDNKHEKATCY